jgi:hypothetical protein
MEWKAWIVEKFHAFLIICLYKIFGSCILAEVVLLERYRWPGVCQIRGNLKDITNFDEVQKISISLNLKG